MSFGQYHYRGPRRFRGPGWHRRRRYLSHYPDRVTRSLWAWPYAGFGQGEPTPVGPTLPAESFIVKTQSGYSYRIAPEQNVSAMLAEISQHLGPAIPVPEGTSYLGVMLPKESVMAGKKGQPGTPLIEWIHARAAEGYGIVISEVESAPLVPMPPASLAPAGVEGLVVATKDLQVASGITMKDDSSAVILEPTGGWQIGTAPPISTAPPTPTKKAGVPGGAWFVLGALALMGGLAIATKKKR